MQYVDFFGHKMSKLIVGDNPFNGWSYIPDSITGDEMRNYYTEEKIHEVLFEMEKLGINGLLPLGDPFMIRVLQHYRANGGKMNFIFQTYGGMLTSFDVSLRLMMAGSMPPPTLRTPRRMCRMSSVSIPAPCWIRGVPSEV